MWVALALNGVYLAVELAVGLISDSLALLSDAGHMASDVAALGLALVAQRLARAQAGPAFTFGLRRVPVLGAFGNALSLVIIAVLILWEAWHRLLHPPEVMAGPVLVAGAIGLVINLVSAWYLHRSAEQSLNIRGAMLHLLADALGSVGAIAAAAIILITGWQPVDALVSVLIAVLLIASTWPLLRDSTKVLLQGAPAHLDLAAVARALEEEDEVLQASDLHVWQIDEGRTVLTGVLATDRSALPELEACALRIKHRLHEEYGIRHATLEWCSPGSAGTACTLS
ncbi:MAG: cation transporter [Deltaproteobacteria bacterium]|nr:cation transporter [Deltaproteobacteria bacterium]